MRFRSDRRLRMCSTPTRIRFAARCSVGPWQCAGAATRPRSRAVSRLRCEDRCDLVLAYLASIGSQDEVGGQQAAGALEDALATVDPPDDRAVEQAGVGARAQEALAHCADVYGVASATHRDPTRLGERCLTAEGYVRLVGDAAAQQAGDGAFGTGDLDGDVLALAFH